MSTVAVIDYGMGNLHSVAKALERVSEGHRVVVSGDPETILAADRVVLPGVGAIRDCMGEIRRLGIDQVVNEVVASKPLLGVCVGMQAMMEWSAENNGVDCLGIFPGKVQAFDDVFDEAGFNDLKIPHMGWNQVHPVDGHPMWRDITPGARFYFVHSYYVEPADPEIIAASSDYGINFTAAVARDNVFAVQFHPEKSQQAGLQLYSNFLRWNGSAA